MQRTELSVVRELSLTREQAVMVSRALAHELIRAGARAKDERLGDETREQEFANLREMRTVADRLKVLAAP